jgi:hypothetical protein
MIQDGRYQEVLLCPVRLVPLLRSIVRIQAVPMIAQLTIGSSARKYVEQFANGVTIICEWSLKIAVPLLTMAAMYLNPVPNTRAPPIEHSIHQVIKEASLLYCLPDNPFVSSSLQTKT